MTVLRPQTGAIPRPAPSQWSEPYWEGARQGELRFQRCGACGQATHTPAVICAHCTSPDLTWAVSAGTGHVYSWTTVWRPQTPAFEVPYVAVVVALDEGFHVLANLIGCEHDAVAVDMPVAVEFHPLDDGVVLPYFRPV